jgi:hypothetical protein
LILNEYPGLFGTSREMSKPNRANSYGMSSKVSSPPGSTTWVSVIPRMYCARKLSRSADESLILQLASKSCDHSCAVGIVW